MLAQNFKSHVDLGISDKEHQALVKVLGMLERGELVHAIGGPRLTHYGHNGFNMRLVESQRDECGSVCCILGWANTIVGDDVSFQPRTQALSDLFLMGDISDAAGRALERVAQRDITTAQAAIALRNYLTTGEPRWEDALAS